MTEEKRSEEKHTGEKRAGGTAFKDGIRASLGILGAIKEAIEETIDEARERGDLSPERAKDIARSAVRRAQDAAEDARERLDFAHAREVEELREEVRGLKARLDELERRFGEPGSSTGVGGDTDPNSGGPP